MFHDSSAAACVSLLVVVAVAAADPVYPQRLTHHSASERARHEAEFRKRNPQHWTEVRADDFGFIEYAFTDDMAFARTDVAGLRAFARRNADLFGIETNAIDRLDHQSWGGVEVVDVDGNNVRGQLDVHQNVTNGHAGTSINAMEWLEPKVRVGDAEIAKQLDGARYVETVTYGYPPTRDCAMTPAGAKNCVSQAVGVRHREVVLATPNVQVVTYYHLEGDELRQVKCVDMSLIQVGAPPPPDPKWQGVTVVGLELAPKAGAPAFPLFIDAVTGSPVALPAKNCNDLRNVR